MKPAADNGLLTTNRGFNHAPTIVVGVGQRDHVSVLNDCSDVLITLRRRRFVCNLYYPLWDYDRGIWMTFRDAGVTVIRAIHCDRRNLCVGSVR